MDDVVWSWSLADNPVNLNVSEELLITAELVAYGQTTTTTSTRREGG